MSINAQFQSQNNTTGLIVCDLLQVAIIFKKVFDNEPAFFTKTYKTFNFATQ